MSARKARTAEERLLNEADASVLIAMRDKPYRTMTTLEVERTRLNYLARRCADAEARVEELGQENIRRGDKLVNAASKIVDLRRERDALKARVEELKAQLATAQHIAFDLSKDMTRIDVERDALQRRIDEAAYYGALAARDAEVERLKADSERIEAEQLALMDQRVAEFREEIARLRAALEQVYNYTLNKKGSSGWATVWSMARTALATKETGT